MDPLLVSLLFGLTLGVFFIKLRQSKPGDLPPGPTGLPLVGNIFDLVPHLKRGPWRHLFCEWKKRYGDVVSFHLFNQTFIVLNSPEAVKDLLEHRASNYSDRPQFPILRFMNGEKSLPFLNIGHVWRAMRRAMHEVLNIRACNSYLKYQMRGSVQLAVEFLQSDHAVEPEVLIERSLSTTLASILYGLPPGAVSELDAIVADLNEYALQITEATLPGAYLVNHVPILEYLPGKWKSITKNYHEKWSNQFLKSFLDAKERPQMDHSDVQSQSFCANLVENVERHGLTDMESAWLAATSYAAGLETSTSALGWLVFALVAYPDVQHKIHEEFDRIVGRGRIPAFDDIERLPYFRAVVKEVLRWRPPVPIGVIHASKEDDMYNGFFIPAGAFVIPNIRALNHDPEVYGSDASEFRPERFLSIGDVYVHEFGQGRRICPGRHLARNTLFSFAAVLWAVRFEGQVEDVYEERAVNILSHPPAYKCTANSRFPGVRDVLSEARIEA